jgi:hypothetical protein
VADDLPEDLALLSRVHTTATVASEATGETVVSFHLSNLQNNGAEHPVRMSAAPDMSLDSSDSTSTYQVSFSQRYHHQLLALF